VPHPVSSEVGAPTSQRQPRALAEALRARLAARRRLLVELERGHYDHAEEARAELEFAEGWLNDLRGAKA
jgi:hypothetical protein